MLKALTKYDYREQFCEALRNSELKQCQKKFFKLNRRGETVMACALGIAIQAGILQHRGDLFTDHPDSCESKLGLNPFAISNMNDDGKTFAEIADWIERQP